MNPKTEAKNEPTENQTAQPAGLAGVYRRYKAWRARPRTQLQEWVELVVSVVVIVFFIRLVFLEAYRIPTGSMENTLLVGDFLLVNKFVYGVRTPDWLGIPFTRAGFFVPNTRLPGFREPKPGDVVVFRYPKDKNLSYIKRCVAVEGQTVEVRDKKLLVDGQSVPEPPLSKHNSDITYPRNAVDPAIMPANLEMRNRDNYGPITVPKGQLFMMGDNRDNSADSRYWGFLPRNLVLGKALIIYFSWDPHSYLYRLNRKIRWERIGRLIH